MARKPPRDNSFRDFILDQLGDIPYLTCRAMFGGHGLSSGEAFFGILHKAQLFFKVSEETRPAYTRRGCEPFQPSAKQTLRSFYEVPADVLDNRADLTQWALTAIKAATTRD